MPPSALPFVRPASQSDDCRRRYGPQFRISHRQCAAAGASAAL